MQYGSPDRILEQKNVITEKNDEIQIKVCSLVNNIVLVLVSCS